MFIAIPRHAKLEAILCQSAGDSTINTVPREAMTA
jgi:hypothetical protein